jgi:general secretion pathway protein D
MKAVLLLLLAVLAACAYNETFVQGRKMIETGHEEEGLALVEQAANKDPDNAEVRSYYLRHKAVAVERFVQQGDAARGANAFDQAEAAYRRALGFAPDNARAKAGLEAVAKDRKSLAKLAEADAALKSGDDGQALAKAKEVLAENPASRDAKAIVRKAEDKAAKAKPEMPQLSAALKKPITMEFRDAPLRTVFELISKKTGLNFVFDKEVPPDAKATVFARNTSIEEVMRFVLVTNQLDKKVMNENTVLIYPNTPAKAHDYKDLIVKSFYLANADVKQTANMIRQVVKTRDLFVDEKLNLLVMRDTAEAIRVAEKLVANQDMGEPEVMLEVQVMEVGYNHLQQLGIQLPTGFSVGLMGAGGVAGQLTGTEAKHLNGGLFRLNVPDPLVSFNFSRQDGRTNVLANPRIRVKNREKARIHIGDRVPVVTTTAGATGFVSESINYLDVGLKLEVEPQVYLDDDVGIKVGLEVSNVANQIKTSSGTVAYQIGTRNAATTLRLKDGETQVLAGLINDEDRRTSSGVPGISDMGALGRLFSNNGDTVNKTEVVLLITPHVVRNIERPGVRQQEFNSGTEAEVGSSGSGAGLQSLQGFGGNPPPASTGSAPSAPYAPPSAPPAGPAPSAAPNVVQPSTSFPAQSPAAGPKPAAPGSQSPPSNLIQQP